MIVPFPTHSQADHPRDGLTLRFIDFREIDINEVLGWAEDPEETAHWLGVNVPHPPPTSLLTNAFWEMASGTNRRFCWSLVENHRCVGHIEAVIDAKTNTPALTRIIVNPSDRNKGHATTMIDAALRELFDHMGFETCSLVVYAKNTAAVSLYAKLLFRLTKVNREQIEGSGAVCALWMQINVWEWRSRAGTKH